MSIEYLETDPSNELKFAFSVYAKRVIVRVSDELYQDEYVNKPREELITALYTALASNQRSILSEYQEQKTLESDPQYTFTHNGLVCKNAH